MERMERFKSESGKKSFRQVERKKQVLSKRQQRQSEVNKKNRASGVPRDEMKWNYKSVIVRQVVKQEDFETAGF